MIHSRLSPLSWIWGFLSLLLQEGEVYIDLTEHSNITHLPDSLSHIDLTKFLENEPNSDKAGASFTPLNDEHEKKGTEARQTTTKVSFMSAYNLRIDLNSQISANNSHKKSGTT